jgi:dienelactone hydrolase/predicted enzyme related to lactoylglutathione lyase
LVAVMRIAQFTVTVRDYDEAIAFYVGKLGFDLVEDTELGGGKRWVRVRPRGSRDAGILLARAASSAQAASVGQQTGGRVFVFVETDDFARDYEALRARGVSFVRAPAEEPYGTVAVFEDLYGNRFDLIERRPLLVLRELLALPPPPVAVAAEVRTERETDDYVVKRVAYRGDEDDAIAAYLFVPRGPGPFPAVVAHHQNNSEFHLGKSEVCGFAGAPLQAFAPALARRGLAVLAPDIVTFEERRTNGRGIEPHPSDWAGHYNELAYRLLRGQLLLRKLLSDALRALSVLAAQPEVDAARIGVVGHSMGATITLYQAALDERVAFACASGLVHSLAARMAQGVGIGMAEVIPGAATRWTIADLLAAAARRPFLVVSAADDPYSNDAVAEVSAARRRGAGATLEHLHPRGVHALDQGRFDAIIEWVAARVQRGCSGPTY